DLQRLQPAAILYPRRIVRDVAVDEGIRLTAIVDGRGVTGGAANVLDDVDVAFVVGMDAFESAFPEKGVQRVDLRRPIDRHLDHAAIRARLLGKEQLVGGGIEGRAVDGAEAGLSGSGVDRSQERDAVRASDRYVQVDPGDIREWSAVLMALE